MSDPVSALGGASFEGFATVREIGPLGMISLRAKPGTKGLDKAIKVAVGTKVPELRQIETAGEKRCGWMSPDEFLLIMPYGEAGKALSALETALKGQHYLAADVSDARAVFRIPGVGEGVPGHQDLHGKGHRQIEHQHVLLGDQTIVNARAMPHGNRLLAAHASVAAHHHMAHRGLVHAEVADGMHLAAVRIQMRMGAERSV